MEPYGTLDDTAPTGVPLTDPRNPYANNSFLQSAGVQIMQDGLRQVIPPRLMPTTPYDQLQGMPEELRLRLLQMLNEAYRANKAPLPDTWQMEPLRGGKADRRSELPPGYPSFGGEIKAPGPPSIVDDAQSLVLGKPYREMQRIDWLPVAAGLLSPETVGAALGKAAGPQTIKYFTSALNRIVRDIGQRSSVGAGKILATQELENEAVRELMEQLASGRIPKSREGAAKAGSEPILGQVRKAVNTYATEQGASPTPPQELRRLKSIIDRVQQDYANKTPLPRHGSPEMSFEDLLKAVREKRGVSVSPEQLRAAQASGPGSIDIESVAQVAHLAEQLFPSAKFDEDQVRLLATLVDKLPQTQKAVIRGTYGTNINPIGQKDMAATLGVSQPRVATILRKAQENLRKMWPGEIPVAQPVETESGDVARRVYEWLQSRKVIPPSE